MPSDRLSTINCSAQLPPLNGGGFTARIWCQFISPASNQASPTATYSTLDTPLAAGVTPSVAAAATMPALPSVVSAGDVYYVESTTDIDLTTLSGGAIAYALSADTPGTSLKLLSTGIILVPVL